MSDKLTLMGGYVARLTDLLSSTAPLQLIDGAYTSTGLALGGKPDYVPAPIELQSFPARDFGSKEPTIPDIHQIPLHGSHARFGNGRY